LAGALGAGHRARPPWRPRTLRCSWSTAGRRARACPHPFARGGGEFAARGAFARLGAWREGGGLGAAVVALDGERVLLAGGRRTPDGGSLGHLEVFSLARGAGEVRPMLVPRAYATATRLRDGRVLVAGGGTRACEIFDPSARATRAAAPLAAERFGGLALALGDGRVAVAGADWYPGRARSRVEVYDPSRDRWSAEPSWPDLGFRVQGVALGDGRSLLYAPDAEGAPYVLFDAARGGLETVAPPPGRPWGTARVALGAGRALLLGAGDERGGARGACHFDADARAFARMPPVLARRTEFAAAHLGGGRVVVAGNRDGIDKGAYSAELFDGRRWSPLPALREDMYPLGALTTPAGEAVFVGKRHVYKYLGP
jgi:hypothetical protein